MGKKYFFEGKWRAVRTRGQFEEFLSDRGVPYPIRKLLSMMSNGGKFEYRIENDCYVETEHGRFGPKVHAPIPLGSLRGVDGKAPSGEKIQKFARLQGNDLVLTNVITQSDCVDMIVRKVGDNLEKTMTNRLTGTSFVVEMQPLDPLVLRTPQSEEDPVGEKPKPITIRDERRGDLLTFAFFIAYLAFLMYLLKLFVTSLYSQKIPTAAPRPRTHPLVGWFIKS